MPLDTNGALLEGVRVSEGNNPFSFPPRDLVSDPSAFSAVAARAEYVLIAASADPVKKDFDIADPDLLFAWSRNDTIFRFSYDSFSKRWLTAPGGAPDVLGPLSNEDRLTMAVPVLAAVVDSPFSVYVGSPVRAVTFTVQVVGEPADFMPPATLLAGTLQVASTNGQMNFSADDVSLYDGVDVLSQRQSFLDRTQANGSFGILPASSLVGYFFFLNPRPASSQTPLVRIGFGLHLTATGVADEASIPPSVPSGTFVWTADTGRVVFSVADVNSFAGETVYYDGVALGSVSPAKTSVPSPSAWPSVAFTVTIDPVGVLDQRYVLYAELAGARSYWTSRIVSSAPSKAPPPGTVVIRSDTGQAYLAPSDVSKFSAWAMSYLDTLMPIEDGVSLQVYRSGVNGSGLPQVPDFTVLYSVTGQIIVDGITQSPFAMLPTVPVVNSDLSYRIEQGPSSSGTFAGPLADGTDPTKPGMAYFLDLDRRQLKYAFRRSFTTTLRASTPVLKVPDAAISNRGLIVTRNGTVLDPGADFGFDATTGVVTFTEPLGQNGPEDRNGLIGTASDFLLDSADILDSDVGKWILVHSGPNVGIRQVTAVTFGRAAVSPPFAVDGTVSFDVRSSADVLVDRFWKVLDPPFKKFSLAVGPGPSGPFSQVQRDGFSVLPTTSQVSLSDPALPGQSFLATYVGLSTSDSGATFTPADLTELAVFKVRQETATSAPGSSIVTFNPGGRTVSVSAFAPMAVYVNGVPLSPGFFEFQAPGTLRLTNPILDGQKVVLDYFVQEALGGETSFNLSVQPLDLDSLQLTAGSRAFSMNGDQTPYVRLGSILWIGDGEAVSVSVSSYDPMSDVTNVALVSAPSSDSAGAKVRSCLSPSPFFVETSPVASIPAGSNSFVVSGDVVSSYGAGTVLSVNNVAFIVSSSQLLDSGSTRVTVASPFPHNLIIPNITRSARPVLDPGRSFLTSRQADLDFAFDLVRMGSSPTVLVRGRDYHVSAGGSVQLTSDAAFGDSLYALYVAFLPQPAGTVLTFNYAHAIAPSQQNGLVGQRLIADYDLYAPDTFFYRVETVLTFLPEVQDLLRQGATSSGTSGPNTRSATGMSNKDFGRASLYYDEQHQGNLDVVVCRLLKFYNDLVNLYEDLLSNLDGRVVGGTSGRFLFDGVLDNPPRASLSAVTNDIDDLVRLYDRQEMTGFFTFEDVPVYGKMGFPNSLSRLFPTAGVRSVALNGNTGIFDYGKTLGSVGVGNLSSIGTITSARSNEFFTSVSGNFYTVDQNGDSDLLVLPFAANQDVRVYADDGTLGVSGKVVSVSGTGPYTVELTVGTSLRRGSIVRDTSVVPDDPDVDTNHFYQPGRDLSVNSENGQLSNNTLSIIFIPSLGGYQMKIWGNEIVDVPFTFSNPDLDPLRIPVLDGSELTDSGRVSVPRLRRLGETDLLANEVSCLGGVGQAASVTSTGKVLSGGFIVTDSDLPIQVGDVVGFTSGPNAGEGRQVSSILSTTSFQVGNAFTSGDPSGSPISSLSLLSTTLNVIPPQSVHFLDGPNAGNSYAVISSSPGYFRVASLAVPDPGSNFEVEVSGLVLTDILLLEAGALFSNVAAPPVLPALIGPVASEIATLEAIVSYSGPVLVSGTGTASPTTFMDPLGNFVLNKVVAGSLLYLPGGALASGTGLYRVASATSSVLTLDTATPYSQIPFSGPASYQVIQPEPFVDANQWGVVAKVLREIISFFDSTLIWTSSISPSGVPARQLVLAARQPQVLSEIDDIVSVLVDGSLYDVRYLWVDQRMNRQDGNLVQQTQAAARRVKNLRKMLADQKKLLVAESIG